MHLNPTPDLETGGHTEGQTVFERSLVQEGQEVVRSSMMQFVSVSRSTLVNHIEAADNKNKTTDHQW